MSTFRYQNTDVGINWLSNSWKGKLPRQRYYNNLINNLINLQRG